MNSDDSLGVHSSTEKTERFSSTDVGAVHRLIAAPTDIFVVLNNQIETDFGGFVSVDDVVFHGRFKTEKDGIRCRELIETVPTDEKPETFETNRKNTFRFMFTFKVGKSSVRIAIGWNKPNGAVDMTRFKVQYNPNKISESKILDIIIKKVSRFAKSVELKRFDMAVDIPVKSKKCVLADAKRDYEYHRGHTSKTEYLGSRSKPGRVKLYDKTVEMVERQGIEIDTSWTRLEITCAGDWNLSKIQSQIPPVVTNKEAYLEDMTPNFRAAVKACSMLIELGAPIDPVLMEYDYRFRSKIIEFLELPNFDIKPEYIQHAIDSAHAETARFNL